DTAEVALVPGPPARTRSSFAPVPPVPPVPSANLGRMTVDEPQRPPTAVGRRALREARRKRQLTAAVCVVVVAALLAITIMIVGIARDRPATPSSSGVAAGLALPGSISSL
ncbi:MAG TPA: hypothetical protein VGF11_02490, partial [Acidimicrobiales bacterium]